MYKGADVGDAPWIGLCKEDYEEKMRSLYDTDELPGDETSDDLIVDETSDEDDDMYAAMEDNDCRRT